MDQRSGTGLPRIEGRIPSLDGLRALSIALVLLAHLTGTRGFPASEEMGRWQLGNLGVRVFFVISGFLITSLLLEEADRHGSISLAQFYLRRCFRIFPAFLVFFAVLVVLDALGMMALRPGDLLATVTYTMNYHHDRSWYVGHMWSLSVEEQFYLLWPAILIFAGIRGGLRAAALVVLLAPPLRVAMGFWPSLRPGIGETFPSVADALATGCVLAGIRPWLSRSARWQRFLASSWFWVTPVAVALSARDPFAKLDWLVGQTVMNVGIAVIIDRTIRMPGDQLGRLLNVRPLVYIGTLSYSLYLWQQVFLNRHGSAEFQGFPWNVLLVAAASVASFYLVEKPFLRLRGQLERWLRARAKAKPKAQAARAAPEAMAKIDLTP
jgi:peptidoglycan/LPS O-acetylase OafA/YrhL